MALQLAHQGGQKPFDFGETYHIQTRRTARRLFLWLTELMVSHLPSMQFEGDDFLGILGQGRYHIW